MKIYHKIQSVFKREKEKPCRFIIGQYSLPEFEYLKDNTWVWDEKVDGTNIRVGWDGVSVSFGGRTDKAQIPKPLVEALTELFTPEKMAEVFPDQEGQVTDVTLHGEGYGARIQKGGGNYIPDGVSFVLFDVRIGHWWMQRKDVEAMAEKLGLNVTPIVGEGTIDEAIEFVKKGFKSKWGDFLAEGLVIRPKVPMFARNGGRIITKIKHKDFK